MRKVINIDGTKYIVKVNEIKPSIPSKVTRLIPNFIVRLMDLVQVKKSIYTFHTKWEVCQCYIGLGTYLRCDNFSLTEKYNIKGTDIFNVEKSLYNESVFTVSHNQKPHTFKQKIERLINFYIQKLKVINDKMLKK